MRYFDAAAGTPLARAVAGEPDQETLRFLERLTLEKAEADRWKGRLKTLVAMPALSQAQPLPRAETLAQP